MLFNGTSQLEMRLTLFESKKIIVKKRMVQLSIVDVQTDARRWLRHNDGIKIQIQKPGIVLEIESDWGTPYMENAFRVWGGDRG